MASETGFDKSMALFFASFPKRKPAEEDFDLVMEVWEKGFQDISDKDLFNAVSKLVLEKTELYPDSNPLAMIRSYAKPQLTETEGDCIELAFEAARSFGYMAEEDALKWIHSKSPLIAAAVRRAGFREICMSTAPDVIRGQIGRIFREEKSRAKDLGGVVDTAKDLSNGLPASQGHKLLSLVKNTKLGSKVLKLKEA